MKNTESFRHIVKYNEIYTMYLKYLKYINFQMIENRYCTSKIS